MVSIMSSAAEAGERNSIFIACYCRQYCRESIHFANVANIRLPLMVRHVAVRVLVSPEHQNRDVGLF